MPSFRFGFLQKAQELGAAVVGAPLEDEQYIGDNYAFQVTEKGLLVYSKKANKVHFLPGR